MPKLPQFENEEPQLQIQNINSQKKGYDAFGQFLGDLADKSAKQTLNIEEEQSNAQLMQSANLAEDLKTSTQKQLLENPNQWKKINENAEYTYESLRHNTYLNKQDRFKFDQIVNNYKNNISLDSARTGIKQTTLINNVKFWDEYPKINKQIEDALNRNDFKTAQILEETLHENARVAAQNRIITPEQFGSIWKTTFIQYDRTKELNKMLNNPEGANAKDYHANTMSQFGSDNIGQGNQPVDENSAWMTNHLNLDRSQAGQFNAIYNDNNIQWGVVSSFSPEKFDEFKITLAGKTEIKSSIRAGVPFNLLQSKMNDLDSRKGFLNTKETGQLQYWKSINKRLKTNNGFYDIMNESVMGAQFTNQHQSKEAAIRASDKTGDDLANALKENDNEYLGNMISASRGVHLDPNFIKPIPAQWRQETIASFQPGAPVLPALQRLAYLNPEYRPYLADSMDKPNQGMALYIAGLALGNTDNSFAADMIQYNQNSDANLSGNEKDKLPSSLILTGKSGNETKKDDIWSSIFNYNDGFKDVYAYLSGQPEGKKATDGLRQAALNYVYGRAQKDGDAELKNRDQYISDFVENTMKGINIYRTDNAVINLNDIQVARQQDVDYLTHNALAEAYKKIHENRSEEEFQRYIDLNPLKVVSTPDKRLVVTDRYGRAAVTKDGHEAYDMPYTTNMLAAAQKESTKIDDYLRNYGVTNVTPDLINNRKEGEFPYPVTVTDVMRMRPVLKERARRAKTNENAILKSRGKLPTSESTEEKPELNFPITPQDVLMKKGK